jgi:hypothetical protein
MVNTPEALMLYSLPEMLHGEPPDEFSNPYSYHLLAAPALDGAEDHNGPLLGPTTLGVEVTDAALARRCGLGNIDPQHGFGAGRARSAIEDAMKWRLPPRGARLVTLRPDPDALGAMAILRLRASLALSSRDEKPQRAVAERVAFIGRHDAFANGPWAAWCASRGPLPRPATADQVRTAPAEYGALVGIAMDRNIELDHRVTRLVMWLGWGKMLHAYRESAAAFAAEIARAWNAGEIGIDMIDGVAVVKSATPGALMLGYRFAPVVLAIFGDALPRKVTIAQFDPAHLDMAAIARRLNDLEPGWGGSATIIGSPQGVGSRLGEQALLELIHACRLCPLDSVSA